MESYYEDGITNEPTSRVIIENTDTISITGTTDIYSKVTTDMEKIITDTVHDINKNIEINMLVLTSAWEKHADSIKERDETIKRLQTNLSELKKEYDELLQDYYKYEELATEYKVMFEEYSEDMYELRKEYNDAKDELVHEITEKKTQIRLMGEHITSLRQVLLIGCITWIICILICLFS